MRLSVTILNLFTVALLAACTQVEPPVLDALGIDIIEMGRGFMADPADWQDWVLPDGTPCKLPGYVNVEKRGKDWFLIDDSGTCLLYTSPSPRDGLLSRMPSSA